MSKLDTSHLLFVTTFNTDPYELTQIRVPANELLLFYYY